MAALTTTPTAAAGTGLVVVGTTVAWVGGSKLSSEYSTLARILAMSLGCQRAVPAQPLPSVPPTGPPVTAFR